MADSILLEVLTPERRVLSVHASEVEFPTAHQGYYGILPGHTPLVTPLGDGVLFFVKDGEKQWITVFGGFAEEGPDHVTILARAAETKDMLDPARAEAARVRAEARLSHPGPDVDLDRARAALHRALERLQAAGKPISTSRTS